MQMNALISFIRISSRSLRDTCLPADPQNRRRKFQQAVEHGEVRRIYLPRARVNRGGRKGRSCYAPALDKGSSLGYYLTNWKLARCEETPSGVPLRNVKSSFLHVLAHALLVFHT
jgi:hypothetical protein